MKAWSSRYPIAVDFSDSTAAVALQMTSRAGLPSLRATLYRDVVSTGPAMALSDEDEVAFVREVLRSGAFKGPSIALLPPLDAILTYPIRVTPGKQETVDAAIVREVRGILDFPIEEAILDCASLQPDPAGAKGTSLALVVVMRKAEVDRHLRLVKQAGGVLELIESASTALSRAHLGSSVFGAAPVLLCHIGHSQSAIVVASREGILAHRNVAWGTRGLTQKLAENLRLEGGARDVEFLLRRHGLLHAITGESDTPAATGGEAASSVVAQLLAPLAEQLAHELHNVLGYVRSMASGATFGGAFLYGDGARIGGLAPYLERELNMPASVLNPLGSLGVGRGCIVPDPVDGPVYALALGLGRRRVRWI